MPQARIFISTGEVSGDIIGAHLAAELQKQRSDLSISGTGGPRMSAAGVRIIYHSNHLGSVGFIEPLHTVPGLVRLFAAIRRETRAYPPAAAVLIGNDLFNTLLSRWLRSRHILTIAYFPPQVWIWRAAARPIARSFDLILASFPEEHEVYSRAGGQVEFVGHYLVDLLASATPERRDAARKRLGVDLRATVVGLLPGTRRHELQYLAPVILGAAKSLLVKDPGLRFLLPVAEPAHRPLLADQIAGMGLSTAVLMVDDSRQAMPACDLALLASGTASLEASLIGLPMVVLYRVSSGSMLGIRAVIRLGLIHSQTVALPNLVLGSEVVPELRQSGATSQALAAEAWSLLVDAGRRREMKNQLSRVASCLGGKGGLSRAAKRICHALDGGSDSGPRSSMSALDARQHPLPSGGARQKG